ncbi:MAG: hypothetical protein U1D69_05820 [Polynucleobacter sp.]|nr:hypothetical protein [Sulfuritalea sp.]MDZ4056477.1 hypothetical protein [Polynucleobacter sp.]
MVPDFGEVVQWTGPHRANSNAIRQRVETLISIFHAIDAGELLAALPECEISRGQHRAALNLIALAERELVTLKSEVGPPET